LLEQEFEQVAAELEIDFEDYYQREQQLDQQLATEQPKVKFIKSILNEIRDLWQQAPETQSGIFAIGDSLYW
jgi:hypothetical protein